MSAYSDANLAVPSLAAYWRSMSGGNLADVEGGFTAAGSNLAADATSLVGDADGSVAFNGTSSKATLAATGAPFDFDGNAAWAVAFRVKPSVTRSGGDVEYAVVSKMVSGGTLRGWEIGVRWDGASKVAFYLYRISTFGSADYSCLRGAIDVPNGVWTDAAFVQTAAGAVTLWVNGGQDVLTEAGGTLAGTYAGNGVAPTIGARGSSLWFPGSLDEIRVFSAALSPAVLRSINRLAWGNASAPTIVPPERVIVTSDVGEDIDDVADLALLHRMADGGELTLAGVSCCTGIAASPGTAKAINDYYLRPDVPIGVYKGDTTGLPTVTTYATTVAADFAPASHRTTGNFPDSTRVLRSRLDAGAAGGTVVLTLGFARDLLALLDSPADGISDLHGSALVAQKVKVLVVVAGNYPTGSEYNFVTDPAAWSEVARRWPTPVVFVPIALADAIRTGTRISETPFRSPVRRAFDLFAANGGDPGNNPTNSFYFGRPAWGQMGVLYVARGPSTLFTFAGTNGRNAVNSSTGENTFGTAVDQEHSYLAKSATDAAFKALIDGFLYDVPDPAVTTAGSHTAAVVPLAADGYTAPPTAAENAAAVRSAAEATPLRADVRLVNGAPAEPDDGLADDVAAINEKLGTPASDSLADDIANIEGGGGDISVEGNSFAVSDN